MKNFLKKPRNIIFLVIIVVLIGWLLFKHKNGSSYDLAAASIGSVVEEVSVTGTTKPAQSVNLSFEHGGRVVEVSADVGDVVVAGEALARLDSVSDQLSLKQAEAALEADEANLADLKNGTRPEDLAVLQSKVASAKSSLSDAKSALINVIKDSYTKADDAVRNYAEQFFDGPRSQSPQLNIQVTDSQLKTNLNQELVVVEKTLQSWKNGVNSVDPSGDITTLLSDSKSNLGTVKDFLDNLSLAVNDLQSTQTLSETTISGYRTSVSTARTETGSAIIALSSGEDAYDSALAGLDLANKNLAVAEAGTVAEKIAEAQAKVDGDQAEIASIMHNINTSVLRAPFGGIVTKQDAKVGETVTAADNLVSVITAGPLEIEAYVPEADIGKMFIGASTTVTLDAFPGETFNGTLSYIDPAETILEGVPTYKVKLAMAVDNPKVKPGMTANLSVVIADHPNVLTIPYRAVQGTGGNRYVEKLLSNGKTVKMPVILGIRGVSGEVEILSGLSKGDTVVIPTIK